MIKYIESKENMLYKELLKIKNKSKDTFYIEGYKLIKEAIKNNVIIEQIIFCHTQMEKYNLSEFGNYKIIKLSKSLFDRLSEDAGSQGIIALVKMKDTTNVSIGDKVIYLDDIRDPGNAGTIIRSARAAGYDTVIFSKNSVNPYSNKVIRSSMGVIFDVDILVEYDIMKLKKTGYRFFGAHMNGYDIFKYANNFQKYVIILGNEGIGISREVSEIIDVKLTIPMLNNVESLNVGVAGSIIMYQLAFGNK